MLIAGCSTSGGEPAAGPAEIEFAPYVDVTSPHPGLASALAESPARRFVLAFALARESRCVPAWGGHVALDDAALRADIHAVRAAGGEVTVATGGAVGTYLENTCATADELAGAYRAALLATGADRLDVDVEADIEVGKVADALATVQRELGVGVTVTVVVNGAEEGLAPANLPLLRALAERGLDVLVNAMVMNFPAGESWRDSVLRAAETVAGQLGTVWPSGGERAAYRRLGLTLMAGRNDTGPVTTLADAQAVREFAETRRIGFLGFWSLARDNGNCPGRAEARNDCSGIAQAPYDFIRSLS